MNKSFEIILIGLDKWAEEAIDLANPEYFKVKEEAKPFEEIDRDTLFDRKLIFIASELESIPIDRIVEKVSWDSAPIIIIPENREKEQLFDSLIINNFRVILSPINNLTSISLSNTISNLEDILFCPEEGDNACPTLEQFFTIFEPRSVATIKEVKKRDLIKATFDIWNSLNSVKTSNFIYLFYEFNFELHSLPEMLRSVKMIEEALVSLNSLPLIGAKHSEDSSDIRVIGLFINHISILEIIQNELDIESSYIKKISIILDKFKIGVIDGATADYIAEKNSILPEDLSLFYKKTDVANREIKELLEVLRYQGIDMDIKVDKVVSVLFKAIVDIDIVTEISDIFEIPFESVLIRLSFRKEGRIYIKEIEVESSPTLKENLDIFIGRNGSNPMVVKRDEILIEHLEFEDLGKDRISLVEEDRLMREEINGWEWFISKNIDRDLVDKITKEIDVKDDILISN